MLCHDGENTTILHSRQMKNQQCQLETLRMVAFMKETFDVPVVSYEKAIDSYQHRYCFPLYFIVAKCT